MLVKDIARIHDRPLYKVNELINNNLKHFKQGIDLLDLKSVILSKDKDRLIGLYSAGVTDYHELKAQLTSTQAIAN